MAGDNPLILVVEDDTSMRLLLERFLTTAGYRVKTAANAAEGAPLVGQLQPAVILTDARMPGVDGFEFCRRLHQALGALCPPVIFVTALGEEDKLRAFAVGGVDYLQKPVKSEALLQLVRKHLETGERWRAVNAAHRWDSGSAPESFHTFVTQVRRRVGASHGPAVRPAEVYTLTQQLGLDEGELASEMARFVGTEYLPTIETASIQLGVLPRAYSEARRVMAIRNARGEDVFVTCNPFVLGLEELDVLANAVPGKRCSLMVTSQSVLTNLLEGRPLLSLDTARRQPAPPTPTPSVRQPAPAVPKVLTEEEASSATAIVEALIADAVRSRASDLHLQPTKTAFRVRYRVDGEMQPVMALNPEQLPSVVARIKVLCGMDIAENRKPQDGQCVVRLDERDVEIRVSTLPATHGEKVVMRILNQSTALRRLDSVGFEPEMLDRFRRLLSARQGMVLVTGPTGSGKTTVMYAALSHLNREKNNVLTVEDPVEMDLEGVTQVQVHDRAGRSFATTLRSMLRQDPDVIMVGEIRDLETAEIACRAALTGHLVLSTLHTQDTLGTLVRLFDMGIPPYLAVASLLGVVAQRLVPRVCEGCARPHEVPVALRAALEAAFGECYGHFRKGAGCSQCRNTGVRGRIAVFELLVLDDALRAALVAGTPLGEIRERLLPKGFRTLEHDAYLKAAQGLIPVEAILALGLGLANNVGE